MNEMMTDIRAYDEAKARIQAGEEMIDQVFNLAQRLRPIDQIRLMVRLTPKVGWMLQFSRPPYPLLTINPNLPESNANA